MDGPLLKAAYNYQTSLKDPGAYAHGGKYIIELMYDSVEDLNAKLAEPVNLTAVHRASIMDTLPVPSRGVPPFGMQKGAVPGSCAKCHSSGSLLHVPGRGRNHFATAIKWRAMQHLSAG